MAPITLVYGKRGKSAFISKIAGSSVSPERHAPTLAVNRLLKTIGVTFELTDPETLFFQHKELSIQLKHASFGERQLVSLASKLVSAQAEEVCVVSYPESGLHPTIQAILGTIFVALACQKPDMKFVVETHSELLILRILRIIRSRLASPDILDVYVVEGEYATLIKADEEGELLSRWPGGFFEERANELF